MISNQIAHRFHDGESCFAGCPAYDSKIEAQMLVEAEMTKRQILNVVYELAAGGCLFIHVNGTPQRVSLAPSEVIDLVKFLAVADPKMVRRAVTDAIGSDMMVG